MNLSTRIEISKPVKFGALAGLIILIWLYHNSQSSTKEVNAIQEIQPPPVVAAPATSTRAPDPKLVVDVYYECLCPDSKYFVTHHLLPTMEKVGSLMDIKLWPYGKATSQKSDAGYIFDCQHGPTECEGNIYHACAAEHISDQETRVKVVACMIENNMVPETAASECAQQHSVYFERIHHCATTEEGQKLHYKAGVKTHNLNPPVQFIPTIEIDNSQHSQKAILKNFIGEICRLYSEKHLKPGQKIANCPNS